MKPKSNRKPGTMDNCQTPSYALDPLILYLNKSQTIWEPAAGEGQIVQFLSRRGYKVVQSDILDGQDYFEYQPDKWDVSITNPPFSMKYDWMRRTYELDKPFALLLPVESIGAVKAQNLFKEYGFEWIFLSRRVNFKMPNKGYTGNGAQFPVFWLTWKLNIGQQVTFATIIHRKDEQVEMVI